MQVERAEWMSELNLLDVTSYDPHIHETQLMTLAGAVWYHTRLSGYKMTAFEQNPQICH